MSERQKTIFDDTKLKLTAKPIEQGCRPPTMQFGTYLNNPQLTVFTNCDNGSGVTMIGAGYDPITFFELLDRIEFFASVAPNNSSATLETLTDIPKERRTDPKVRKEVKSVTQLGRDEEGKVWLSIQDAKNSNAPKVRFYFQTNFYHRWKFSGVQMSHAENSQSAALAWVHGMRAMVGPFMINNPNAAADGERARAKWSGNGGGQGGGNKSYGGNNGGGNKSYGNNGGNKSYGNNGGGNKSYGNNGGSKSHGAAAAETGDGFSEAFDDDDY